MRDPNRIPQVLKAIGTFWEKYPDLRLGQIISNAHATWGVRNDKGRLEGWDPNDVFYFEDDDLLKTIYEEINKNGEFLE